MVPMVWVGVIERQLSSSSSVIAGSCFTRFSFAQVSETRRAVVNGEIACTIFCSSSSMER